MNGETTSIQVDMNVSQDSHQKCSNQTGDTKSRGEESEEMGVDSKPNIQFDKSDIQKISKNVSCQ